MTRPNSPQDFIALALGCTGEAKRLMIAETARTHRELNDLITLSKTRRDAGLDDSKVDADILGAEDRLNKLYNNANHSFGHSAGGWAGDHKDYARARQYD